MKNKVYYKDIDTNLSPEDSYLRLTRENSGILFESSETDTGYTFICCDPHHRIEANEDIIEKVKKSLSSTEVEGGQKPYIGGAYGNISYDTIRDYENIPETNKSELEVADSTMLFSDRGMVYNHNTKETYLTVVSADEKKAHSILEEMADRLENTYQIEAQIIINGKVTSSPTKEMFMKNVDRAKEYILSGDIFQVVISQRFSQESNMNPFEFYKILKRINPSPYMFFLDFGTHHIIGSSPERMVSLNQRIVKTVPIAGTRKRGDSPAEDEALAKDLLTDEKERAEHNMLVDLARNDIGRVAKTGSIKVTELMKVKKFSHVMHLVSLVEGEVTEDKDAYSVLASTLPAGTLSGAPKIRAMEIIEELEGTRRGFYGGAIGYVNYSGEMDTAIAIRTVLHKKGKYTYQAGAGIVADSVPESEYTECINKGKSITKVFLEVL